MPTYYCKPHLHKTGQLKKLSASQKSINEGYYLYGWNCHYAGETFINGTFRLLGTISDGALKQWIKGYKDRQAKTGVHH